MEGRAGRGQALAELAIVLVVLVVVMAFVLDFGILALTAMELQTAVTAGAMAGAAAAANGHDPVAAAQEFVARNGSIMGPVSVDASVNGTALIVRGDLDVILPFGFWTPNVGISRTVTLSVPPPAPS
jgi:uncharacterized membrane protein